MSIRYNGQPVKGDFDDVHGLTLQSAASTSRVAGGLIGRLLWRTIFGSAVA
jgi:hypothetical protein